MIRSTSFALAFLLLLASFAAEAEAHGGSYRQPPPGIRIPTPGGGLPTPTPPVDGGGGTPTPGLGNPGAAPGGRGGWRPPPIPAADPLNWEIWWTYNRDRYLQVRRTLSRRQATTGAEAKVDDWRGEVIRALIEALDAKHVDLSTGAAVALGKTGDLRGVEPLVEKLRSRGEDRTLRESAALALGMLGSEECRAALTDVLLDRNEPDRLRAFAAYGLGMTRSAAAVPALATVIRMPKASREARAAALIASGAVGEDIVMPLLVDALKGKIRTLGDFERACAADGLGRLADPAGIPVLLKAAIGKDRVVRQSAVLALGRIRGDDEKHRAFLALRHLALQGDDRTVRTLATISLGRTGRPEATIALLQLSDRAKYVGQKGFAILGAAIAVADSTDAAIRERVASSLRTRLERKKFSLELRGAAAAALGILRDEKAVPVLTKLVAGKGDPGVRGHAALALGIIGDASAVPVLREALNPKGDPSLLREVALALGLLGDSDSMRTMVELVQEGRSEWVRSSAAMGVARIGGPLAARAMIDLMQDRQASGPTRGIAAVALGHLMETRDVPALALLVEDINFLLPFEAIQELLTIL